MLRFLSDDAASYLGALNRVCDHVLPPHRRPRSLAALRRLDARVERLELFRPELKHA